MEGLQAKNSSRKAVPEQMECLNGSIDALSGKIQKLENALEPVLEQVPIDNPEAEKSGSNGRLSSRILSARCRIEQECRNIDSLLERLEL